MNEYKISHDECAVPIKLIVVLAVREKKFVGVCLHVDFVHLSR